MKGAVVGMTRLAVLAAVIAMLLLGVGSRPSEHDQHMARGYRLLASDLVGQAAIEFGDVIADDPQDLHALIYYAKATSRFGVNASSLDDVTVALEVDRGAALELMSHVFSSADMEGLASLYYVAASKNLRYVQEHARGRESLTNELTDRLRSAAEDFRTAIDLNPEYFAAYVDLGLTYLWWGRLDRAIESFDKAVVLLPSIPEVYAYRGSAYRDIGDLERAVADLTKSLQLNAKNPFVYVDRSLAYLAQAEYDLAIADATSAIALRANDANAYYNRGFAYSELRQFELAIADFTSTVELDESFTYAYHMRGMAYAALGDVTKAVADLKAAQATSDDPAYERWVESIIEDLESGRNTQPACLFCRPT